ncbi:hypothetical protein [Streptomyces canus]|uniref:hypothetical protein n=1 Tax=Streptomyces canus TaxID=58343 RepID=UPI00324A1539
MVAIVPMPMAMLVVAAVLDAAMATPSTTPRERRRAEPGAEGGGGADDMRGSSGTGDGEEPRGEVMEQPTSTLGQPC